MEDGVDKREGKLGVNLDPGEEEIEDVVLDDERDSHWHIVFQGQQWRGG